MRDSDKTNSDARSNREKNTWTRRRILQSAGITAAALVGTGTAAGKSTNSSQQNSLGDFHVSGKKITHIKIRPKKIETKERRISSDLKRRYGSRDVVSTSTLPRPDGQDDGLPESDTRTIKEDWDAYYAKEGEWTELARQNPSELSVSIEESSESSVGTEAISKPNDCPKYDYENVNGGFEISGPMNLAAYKYRGSTNLQSLENVLTSNGWTGRVVQYNRYTIDPNTHDFEIQDNSVATTTDRTLGGKHVRMWSTGSYITMAAHQDTSFPHHVKSYNVGEFTITGIFQDSNSGSADVNRYNFHNGGYKDHGGYVSRITAY